MHNEPSEPIRPDHLCAYIFGLALVATIMFHAFNAHIELRATARGITLVMIAVTAIAHLHHRVMQQLDSLHAAAALLVAEVARARTAMQDTRSQAHELVRRVDELVCRVQQREEAAFVEGYAKGATTPNEGTPNLRPVQS